MLSEDFFSLYTVLFSGLVKKDKTSPNVPKKREKILDKRRIIPITSKGMPIKAKTRVIVKTAPIIVRKIEKMRKKILEKSELIM